MITTFKDCYRADLPIEVLRAQARIAKIVMEWRVPPRLLPLCTYLVSTTSLAKHGRVHLARHKVAKLLEVSERTIDRHFDELEARGILNRQVRARTPGGWFYGTCIRWTETVWDALFVKPGRTRTEAVNELHAKRAAVRTAAAAMQVEATSSPALRPIAPTEILDPVAKPDPQPVLMVSSSSAEAASDQGTSLDLAQPRDICVAQCSLPPTTVLKGGSLNASEGQTPTFQQNTGKQEQPTQTAFRIPLAVAPWALKLGLGRSNIAMLMATAKKTDVNKTRTRLQDLLAHVGDRLIKEGIKAESASCYLYRCLTKGEDYSAQRFNAVDSPTHESREVDAANSLRKNLPEGQITVLEGLPGVHLVRCGYAVSKVDPALGLYGPSKLLTREQMAVMARRAGLAK